MSAERAERVKPVHVTKTEAVVAVASGIMIGEGIVLAPLLAIGGGLTGLGMALHVRGREAEEKARQRSVFKKQGEIVGK